MSEWFPDKFECIVLRGNIVKWDDETDWTEEEGEAFMEDFFDWLDSRRLAFGGAFGAPAHFKHNERD